MGYSDGAKDSPGGGAPRQEMPGRPLPAVLALQLIRGAQQAIVNGERIILAAGDAETIERNLEGLKIAWQQADERMELYESLERTRQEVLLWKGFSERWEAWKRLHREVVSLAVGPAREARKAASELASARTAAALRSSQEILESLIDLCLRKGGAPPENPGGRGA